MFRLLLACLVTLAIPSAQGQDIGEFLDDDVEFGSNGLKIQLLTLLNGEIGLIYERSFGERSGAHSLEIGVGLQIADYWREYSLLEGSENLELSSGGPHFYFSYRRYFPGRGHSGAEGPYATVLFRRRSYDLESGSIAFSDLCSGYGFQFFMATRVIVDLNVLIGLRFNSIRGTQIEESLRPENPDFIPAAQARIGYMF